MIYITGDIHGSPERLGVHSFYEQKEMTRDDIVIICGDFGMVWEESGESASEQYWLKWLEDKPFTTLFVCGNHENFDRLYQYPVKEWHGGKVHEIRPHVLHLMRGEVFDIEGLKFFAFGGAIMGCTALTATQWGITVGLAFMIIPIDLVRKTIIKVRRK